MKFIITCIDCGSHRWVGTDGKRYCAECGSDRVRNIVDVPRKEAPCRGIGEQILSIVKDAIKQCATYDIFSKKICVDHKRIREIVDSATEAMLLIHGITNG